MALCCIALFAAAAAAPPPGDTERGPAGPVAPSPEAQRADGGGGGWAGYCARFLYLVQCAKERPTPELAAGPEAAALQLVYRTPPRTTCPATEGAPRPRPARDVELPAAGGGGKEPAARVYGDCTAGGVGPPPAARRRSH